MIKTIKANAFGQGVEWVRVLVEADGSIYCWDDIAGHYTRCHRLTAADVR